LTHFYRRDAMLAWYRCTFVRQ